MEIRNPLIPLNPAGDLRAGQRRVGVPAGGFADLVGGSGGEQFRVVREAPATDPSSSDYAELLRQSRLQRVPASRSSELPPDGDPTRAGRALSAYRETVRMALSEGSGELVGVDTYA